MKLWLNGPTADFVGSAEISRKDRRGRQKSSHAYLDRRGIAMFRNFWGAGNSGDHIDLWNGARIALGDLDFFERSQEIWFWEMT